MGRTAIRKRTGKASKPGGRKQFNASLPEQLVLDFNRAADEQGRDNLLRELLLGYLEKSHPRSRSVLQFKSASETEAVTDAQVAQRDEVMAERRALTRVREYAEAIVNLTTGGLKRRGPKAAKGGSRNRRIS